MLLAMLKNLTALALNLTRDLCTKNDFLNVSDATEVYTLLK
jgi:hypothetical protein